MSSTAPRPLVLVAVGTDHHPFDRVVRWIDAWLADGAGEDVDVLVQYGHSQPPTIAQGSNLLDHDDLQDAMARAAVVVCHGGPATITEARRHGKLPICVPRDPDRGEHVDSHQQLFARRMGAGGIVALAETQDDLRATLDRALNEPASFQIAVPANGAATASTDRFADLVSPLLPPVEPPTRVPVLYLGGLGRSGSTLLERAIAQLSPKQQLVIRAKFWEGLSEHDIARREGISRSTVQMHLSRATTRLKWVMSSKFPISEGTKVPSTHKACPIRTKGQICPKGDRDE